MDFKPGSESLMLGFGARDQKSTVTSALPPCLGVNEKRLIC